MSSHFTHPPEELLFDLLRHSQNLAVVGLSPNPERVSYQVALSMQDFGYRILPVRPDGGRILGEPVYPSLSSIDEPIDLVVVFRAPKHQAGIVDECLRLNLPAIWMQDGSGDPYAAQTAHEGGMQVIMDRCVYRDFKTFARQGHPPK